MLQELLLCTLSYLCALMGLRCCKCAVCVMEGLNIAISICKGSAGFAQETINILDLHGYHKCDHQKYQCVYNMYTYIKEQYFN